MKVHELKAELGSLAALADGVKTAELRYDDRGYEVGDILVLRQWREPEEEYGNLVVVARVTHKLHADDSFGALYRRYRLLSLKVLDVRGR